MSEMVDRAVKAAFNELQRLTPPGDSAPDDFSEHHEQAPYTQVMAYSYFDLRSVVRAAIATMREPPQELRDAVDGIECECPIWLGLWETMMDTALKE